MKRFTVVIMLCVAVAILSACGGKSIVRNTADGLDIDLSIMSGTVVYSQVYDMVYNPENYIGQTIKISGSFAYHYNDETSQEYFAVLIADALACCSQGIEFVLNGDYSYPDDYPALDTEITVMGIFNTYQESGYTYCQLLNASLV